jgi:hypothetical protein
LGQSKSNNKRGNERTMDDPLHINHPRPSLQTLEPIVLEVDRCAYDNVRLGQSRPSLVEPTLDYPTSKPPMDHLSRLWQARQAPRAAWSSRVGPDRPFVALTFG